MKKRLIRKSTKEEMGHAINLLINGGNRGCCPSISIRTYFTYVIVSCVLSSDVRTYNLPRLLLHCNGYLLLTPRLCVAPKPWLYLLMVDTSCWWIPLWTKEANQRLRRVCGLKGWNVAILFRKVFPHSDSAHIPFKVRINLSPFYFLFRVSFVGFSRGSNEAQHFRKGSD